MKLKLYGKLLEELQLSSLQESFDSLPTFINDNDVPQLANIFNFLNNKDRDILFLIFLSQKTQTDIVKILKRSQPSLSYDIGRIKERIKFICTLHSYFNTYTDWLKTRGEEYSQEQIMVLTLMFFTTSFSQSSRVSGIKPTRIRYIFDKTLEQLKINNDNIIYDIFINIRNNLNTVKREYKKV